MAFFPYVNPGDPVKPSTLLENNIRDVVNQFNATGELPVSRGSANSYRLQCWNNNDYVIPAGASVEIVEDAEWAGDAPQIRYASSNADLWGITACVINPGEIGSVIFAGLATVRQTYDAGFYLQPDGLGGFKEDNSGAMVLCKGNDQSILLLGGGSAKISAPGYFVPKLIQIQAEHKIFLDFNEATASVRVFGRSFGFTPPSPIDITSCPDGTGVYLQLIAFENVGEDYLDRPVFAYVTSDSGLISLYPGVQPYVHMMTIRRDEAGNIIVPNSYCFSSVPDLGGHNDPMIVPYFDGIAINFTVRPKRSVLYPYAKSEQSLLWDFPPGHGSYYLTLTIDETSSTPLDAAYDIVTSIPESGMYCYLCDEGNMDRSELQEGNFFIRYLL